MLIFPSDESALDNYYEQVTSLVHYSEGRYNLKDVEDMIPWELNVYLGKFSKYIDKINK